MKIIHFLYEKISLYDIIVNFIIKSRYRLPLYKILYNTLEPFCGALKSIEKYKSLFFLYNNEEICVGGLGLESKVVMPSFSFVCINKEHHYVLLQFYIIREVKLKH